MIKKSIITALILLAFNIAARAQFNDSTKYHLTVASTGAINKTDNSTAYLLNNALAFGIRQKDLHLNYTSNWIYGKQNGQLTNNDYSTALFVNLYKTFPHFYYWGLVNYNTSYSLHINNQFLAGAGAAYIFIDKKNATINVSDGVLYDQSSLLTSLNYHTYRNSLRVQYHFVIGDTFTIDSSNFLQSAFNNGKDYIIRSTTTLGLRLRKWISLTTALNYNKMNITSSSNTNLTYGIALDKYF